MADLNPTERIWARLTEADEWRRQMSAEMAQLPATIADLRETISDLRKLTSRLERATSGLEILIRTADASGVNDLARRIDDASSLVEQQTKIGTDIAGAAFDELQRTVASATKLLGSLAPKPQDRSSDD